MRWSQGVVLVGVLAGGVALSAAQEPMPTPTTNPMPRPTAGAVPTAARGVSPTPVGRYGGSRSTPAPDRQATPVPTPGG
jgi:hypothetical protein